MFAMKDTRQQSRHFASSSEKQHEGTGVAPQTITNTSLFLQRYLSNSYLQSTAESRQALNEASAQNVVPILQRKCSCGGSCASCAGKEEEMREIQTKLTIGAANDVYEQEADRVAEQVIRMPDSSVQPENEQSNAGINIRRVTSSDNDTLDSHLDIKLNQSGGHHPLSPSTRQFMEPRFGVDFGHVRLHTDDQSHQLHHKSKRGLSPMDTIFGWGEEKVNKTKI
ncbi:MAG: DUF4157 domain-containing protein [Methylococcales bacterium]|nr:DUF4157 domain-containing protein [Methylococcales bacterium]